MLKIVYNVELLLLLVIEDFRTGTKNTTLFHENCNVLENMRIYPNV